MIKKLETAANLVIIVTASLLCVVLIGHLVAKPPAPVVPTVGVDDSRAKRSPVERIQPGTKLSIAGIDWAKNGRTLLIAVSDKCHFCTESAPFYRQLVRDSGATQLVAVLPQPVEDGKKYLQGLNVAIHDVRQVPLTSVGIRATPTLILVDSHGVAIDSWMGRLPAPQETAVLTSLQQREVARN
jgi:hypothetical protein